MGDFFDSLMDEARTRTARRVPDQSRRSIADRRDPQHRASPRGASRSYLQINRDERRLSLSGVVAAEDQRFPRPAERWTGQGGTLLPDRDYYLKDDGRFVRIRAQYVDYLSSIFALAGRQNAATDARAVLALETSIARLQWTPEQTRDPASTAKKFSLAALEREMPGFDWARWARPQGIDRTGYVILAQPSFFKSFAALVETTAIETGKMWLLSRLLTAAAPYLTPALSDARFEFFGRVLSGQELPRTHWKRGVGLVDGFLGDATGRLYVERHFPASSKVRVEKLVATLVVAFRQALTESAWMSEFGKRSALAKLSTLSTRVGYPDRWRDYHGLLVKPDDLFGNVQRARQFDGDYRLRRLSQPAANGEWLMTPQTVNAYYNPVHQRNRVAGSDAAAATLQCGCRRCGELWRDWRDCGPRDRSWLRRPRAPPRRQACATGGRRETKSIPESRGHSSSSSMVHADGGRARQRPGHAARKHRRSGRPRDRVAGLTMSLAGRLTGHRRLHRRAALLPELGAGLAWKGDPRRVPPPDASLDASRAARVSRERPGQQHGLVLGPRLHVKPGDKLFLQ